MLSRTLFLPWLFIAFCSCAVRSASQDAARRIVETQPGEYPESISGPMPGFGPYQTVDEAIFAACPLVLDQPEAVIPVPPSDQNFRLYWNVSREYCAWLYSPDGKEVSMSFLAMSPVQDVPGKRQCRLPGKVTDRRYPAEKLAHVVVLHSHPFDRRLSDEDLLFLGRMANLHGMTALVDGHEISISIVAFFGKLNAGRPVCDGFYQYLPARNSELVRMSSQGNGQWERQLLGHIKWNENGTPNLVP